MVTAVYMRTPSGARFQAKVDVDGISNADQLLRGLRAAYVHYTNDTSPPVGALTTTIVLSSGNELAHHEVAISQQEIHLIENSLATALPPLASLLPCSHIVMQGYPSALMASQQHHLQIHGFSSRATPCMTPARVQGTVRTAGGALGGGAGTGVPRPSDFCSIPVMDSRRAVDRRTTWKAPANGIVDDDAWHEHATSRSAPLMSRSASLPSVRDLRQQFGPNRAVPGCGANVTELKARLGAPKGRASYRGFP